MGTSPNETLLQASKGTPSNVTPAQLALSSSRVTFAFQGVQPPSVLYVDVDDALVLQATSNQGSEQVTFNVRLLLPDGRIEDNQFILKPTSGRVTVQSVNGLAQGYLLSLSVLANTAFTRGQTFARAFIKRGASGVGQPGQMLFADYVTTAISIGYPNGRILSPTEGPGWVHGISQAGPAAGADFIFQTVNNQRLRVMSALTTLTTSAAVANRNVEIEVQQNANLVSRLSALASIVASTVAIINMAALTPYTGVVATDVLISIPPGLTLAGISGGVGQIQSLTTNLQAADQYGNFNALVEEWLENV